MDLVILEEGRIRTYAYSSFRRRHDERNGICACKLSTADRPRSFARGPLPDLHGVDTPIVVPILVRSLFDAAANRMRLRCEANRYNLEELQRDD
jgi:hypothetical protein